MFGKLREKLKSWARKISEKAPEPVEEPKEKLVKKEKKSAPKKEIPVPQKFNVATQKVEPDLERLKEISEEKENFAKTNYPRAEREEEGGRAGIPKQNQKPSEEEPRQGFFSKITSRISKVKIAEKEFEVYAEELEMLLLENNVALEVAEKIIRELRENIVGKELLRKEIEGEIYDTLKEIIEEILVEPFDIVEQIKSKKEKPYVILFCGINGSGKTTTAAKIAVMLKEKNLSCVLAAADTFRAASIEQLKKHGERVGVKVIAQEYGADPAAVGFDAIAYAKKNHIDAVLIDTAGRIHTSKNLLKEIEKVARVCKPDTKIFVGESITGNDAVEQIKTFNWEIGIDGIILSKADIDEKGGTALSVGYVTKKPILFLGTGQEYEKIEIFDKQEFIKKLGL